MHTVHEFLPQPLDIWIQDKLKAELIEAVELERANLVAKKGNRHEAS